MSMRTATPADHLPEGVTAGRIHVLGDLGLQCRALPSLPRATLVHQPGSEPIAVLLEQGETLREDLRAIASLKATARGVPIIYLARIARPERERAIRQQCIHYFIAPPVEAEELRLVLEALARAGSHNPPFERFFTT